MTPVAIGEVVLIGAEQTAQAGADASSVPPEGVVVEVVYDSSNAPPLPRPHGKEPTGVETVGTVDERSAP